MKLGVNKPPRVKVRFVDDRFEGKEEWVPAGRLKTPWPDAMRFAVRERALAALEDVQTDDILDSALWWVFEKHVDERVARLGWTEARNALEVLDRNRFRELLGPTGPKLLDAPAYEENGSVYFPVSRTIEIAKALSRILAQTLLREVDDDEAEGLRDSIYGTYNPRLKDEEWRYISPETHAAVFEERTMPLLNLMRSWCGEEEVDLRTQIEDLRGELARVGAIARAALMDLRAHGRKATADRLSLDLRTGGRFGPDKQWLSE